MTEIDISTEQWRLYTYADGTYRIDAPVALHITDSGSHRVIDADGVTHRPTPGWLGLSWKPRDGQQAFVA